TNTIFTLVVENRAGSVNQDLTVRVGYRGQTRAIGMPFARAAHAAVTLNDGRVLIVGGRGEGGQLDRRMYVFDPALETFSLFGSLAVGRTPAVAVKLADGNVLLVSDVA